ncbi:MAG: hypothetical protein GXY50_10630 [Syntrophomonadaceae bacterium]|nr:hypothetical protein [Syntrophomonadaceae bacterium]
MGKKKFVTLLAFILVGTVSVLILTSCGDAPEKNPGGQTADSKQTSVSEKSSTRINDLVKAWGTAGINAEVKEKSSSSTLNSMYGCSNQYTVLLDNEQFMLLEYDLKNLNSTAERYLKFIDENGYDSKNNDPVWHNEEFVLPNSFSLIENGEVVAEYLITEHPQSEQILDIFQSFK